MTALDFDWIASAALAVWLGWAGPKSLKRAIGLCAGVALFAWVASYLIMFLSPRFGGNTTTAETYINGFSAPNAVAEMAAALAWTLLWFGLVRVALFFIARLRRPTT
jgi:hypothetical protein